MKRILTALAILALAVPATAKVQERIKAQYPANLQLTTTNLTLAQVKALSGCKLRFYLKAGMTNSEANSAIDDGYNRFFDCLRNKGKVGRPTR